MPSAGRNLTLQNLVVERDLRTTGFRLAMRELTERLAGIEDLDDQFREWFGDCHVAPAAWQLAGEGPCAWDYTVHIYEIEWSGHLNRGKLGYYADITDGEGPHLTLHLIDSLGTERVLDDGALWCRWHEAEAMRRWPSTDPTRVLSARKAADSMKDRKKRSGRLRERERLALEIVQQLGIKI